MSKITSVIDKSILFIKDDAGWYADMEGTRAQNAMVSGADVMCEVLAQGKHKVALVFSSDCEPPKEYLFEMTRVEHDPWGATYSIGQGTQGEMPRVRGIMGLPLAWLCNQTHRFIGGENGEHPKRIYVTKITPQD